MSKVLDLTIDLISRPSVTPEDEGCQQMLTQRLEALGFECEHMRFDDVDNLWARKGTEEPVLAFAGHTDVVPTGPVEDWASHPFKPEIRDGVLYGRGAADMKGSIAAFITALEKFLPEHTDHKGSIALLITSDEEGPSINGTVKVVEALEARNEKITWCLVGEPSSTERVGDVVKNGRRGSHGARLTIHGKQGHVAYPHLARNPVHEAAPALAELAATEWDQGNDYFPPTTFQISNINAGTGATNVIPGTCDVVMNLRYSTETNHHRIEKTVAGILDKHNLEYEIDWTLSGMPFITEVGELTNAASEAIKEVCGYETELSTAGGTSDGRFIAPTGAQVLEVGPRNATIHQIDECVAVAELENLEKIYIGILERLVG